MKKALVGGSGPSYIDANTPFIGAAMSDTPYTSAERNLNEVVGRLQSGGAINDEENKRFKAMGPRPSDSPEIQMQKIASQQSFLENKLSAYRMKPTDLTAQGFNLADNFNVKENKPMLSDVSAPGSSNATATPVTQMTRQQKIDLARSRGLLK